MASQPPVNPNLNPNVNPQQQWAPPPRRRSIFGPVFLIGMGIVLLLVSSGRLSGREVFRIFADYWPLLLILWGVIKLVEYMQAKRDGLPAPGIGGGGVVLLIFLVLFGTAISGVRRGVENVDWNKVGDHVQFGDEDLNDMFGGNKYQYNDTIEKDFPANANLKVALDRGDINVVPSTDDKIHVMVKKTVYAENEGEGKKMSDAFIPSLTLTDNIMNIDALPKGDWKGRVDLQIQMPRKAAVDLMTLKGTLTVNGRDGEVKAHNSNGDVSIEDVASNVTAHMRGGNFSVKKVKGDVNLEGRGNNVEVRESGSLTLQGEFDEIQMANIAKTVHFNSVRTSMEFGKLDGELNMSNGELRANTLAGPFRLVTRNKDVELEDISGDVKIDDTNGTVQVTPKAPVANMDITNKSGEVTLMLPANGNFTVDATSTRGEIESDFDLNQANNQGHETHSTGTIGKGGPRVQVRDEHATIRINKR